MTQYMLSVNHVEGEPMPSGEDMQRVFDDVDRFNTELQDAGAWVFAGGLMPRETVDHRRQPRGPSRSSPTARSPRPRSGSAASG